MSAPIRLDLGGGLDTLPGYKNIDGKTGGTVYPLDYADNSVDEIRASHLLEHFGHQQTVPVLLDWVRALKPGGRLRLAVPDLDQIIRIYQDAEHNTDAPVEKWLVGGQSDQYDLHKSVFNEPKLRYLMESVGLEDIRPWDALEGGTAGLPISLRLIGTKPVPARAALESVPLAVGKVSAVISVPRLGFMDHFHSAMLALGPLGIPIVKVTGAFWGQCLTRGILQALEAGADYVLTLDYDTLFTRQDVETLLRLAATHPEYAAIASLQAHRSRTAPMLTVAGSDGNNRDSLALEELQADLLPIRSAHFGLTVLRGDVLRQLPHPWFWSKPDPDGRWGEARVDEDIAFWALLEREGHKAALAPRVVVGHAELVALWPGRDLQCIRQPMSEYQSRGKPQEAWQ